MAEEVKSEIPIVQNEVTKKLGYVMLINGMLLADMVAVAALFYKIEVPEIVVQVILGKLLLGTLLLGYLKYIREAM